MSNFRSVLRINESNSGLRILKDSLWHLLQNHSRKALLRTVEALISLGGFNIVMGCLQGLAGFNMSKSGHQPSDQPEEDQREICGSAKVIR